VILISARNICCSLDTSFTVLIELTTGELICIICIIVKIPPIALNGSAMVSGLLLLQSAKWRSNRRIAKIVQNGDEESRRERGKNILNFRVLTDVR